MDTVYKYCGSFGLDILCNLELKITPPNQFNDPFEFTPKMFCSNSSQYANRFFKSKATLKKLYEMKCKDGGFVGSFRDFREFTSHRKPELIALMKNCMEETLPLSETNFLDRVSEQNGILCLTQRRDSILMWGHYCHRNLGIVIGFNKSCAAFKQGGELRPVVYVKERVPFDAVWQNGSIAMTNFTEKIIYSKSDEWSYEQELRQFVALSKLKSKPLKNGMPGYFLPIFPKTIASVTLAPRCSTHVQKEVQKILAQTKYLHVELDRAVLNKHSFKIEFESIRNN